VHGVGTHRSGLLVGGLLVGVLAAALASGCGDKTEDSAAVAAVDCDRSPPLVWDNFGKGLMDKHCNGCHSVLVPESQRQGAPTGVDFNTYADVIEWRERIRARATTAELESPTMPPGGGPGAEELALLEEWLACEVAKDAEALAAGGGR
jgi:uncharacterized membrane protein